MKKIDDRYRNNGLLETVSIELTDSCNLNCRHCYLDTRKKILDTQTIFCLLTQLREHSVFNVKLTGGEITTCKDLPLIIKKARELYFNVILLSNLTNLNKNLFDTICEYYVSNVETTIFSIIPNVHDDFVNCKGAYNRTISNIKRLLQAGIHVTVKTWALKFNLNELQEMERYFTSLGCTFKIYLQIYCDVNGKEKLPEEMTLNFDEYKRALILSDLSNHYIFPNSKNLDTRLCDELLNSVYISSNGDVYPCVKFRKSFGSIYQSSIMEVWNSTDMKIIRNYSYKDQPNCNRCCRKEYCNRCGALSVTYGYNYLDNIGPTCKNAIARTEIGEKNGEY